MGESFPIFAQGEISTAQLLRARNLPRFFLTNAPETVWGEDKTAVANAMADNGAAHDAERCTRGGTTH